MQIKFVLNIVLLLQIFYFIPILCLNIPKTIIEINWTHSIKLPGGFQLKWISTNETWITMEMSAPTKGYLGIGFSINGGMTGSDIVIGWIDDNGTPHLKDYYGTKNGAPTEDTQQDYKLLDAKEDDFGTTLTFRRKWNTCDEKHDWNIGDDTVRLIWAWHAEDPKEKLHWHGSGVQRGAKSIYLKVLGKPKSFPDDKEKPNLEVKHWDIRMQNYVVPNISSYYHCRMFTFPKLDKKHHVVGYRPLIAPDRVPYVHHISIFRCHVPEEFGDQDTIFGKYIGDEGKGCFGHDTPKDWNKYCFTFFFANAIGAEGDIFPENLGFPIDEQGNKKMYLRFEIHYENPQNEYMVDSSGLRIFYTPTLRDYDLAMMFVGYRRTPFLSIPPFQTNFKISGNCPSECTQAGLPENGVKLISVLLHAHLAGRKLTLRHIRQGKELPVIAQDHAYDFNYQEYRVLSDEVLLLPGDELIMECDYNTEDRNNFTLGGLSSQNEMCEAFIYYYPKSNLVDCRTQLELYSYLNPMDIKNVSGQLINEFNLPFDPNLLPEHMKDFALEDDTFILSAKNSNSSIYEMFNTINIDEPNNMLDNHLVSYMDSLNWKNEKFNHKVENSWRNAPRYTHCATPTGKRIKHKHYVSPITKYETLPSIETQRHQSCEQKQQ